MSILMSGGPTKEPSMGGSRYFVTFADDFSRKVWVYFMVHKSEVFAKFKVWKAEVENQTGRKIKYLRTDNGTEYTEKSFIKFCEENGIHRHFSVRKTPHQNGVAERINRTLTERARCLRLNAGLSIGFRAAALNMAYYLVNRSPRTSLEGKVLEEVWTGNPIDLSNLRIFGSPVYVHISSEDRSKLDHKSSRCIFIGFNKGVKGYKLWDPVKKKVVVSRDVIFDEQSMLNRSEVTDLPETGEGSTSRGDKIQWEMVLPDHSTVSPGQIVEPEGEPGSDQEKEGGATDQDETQEQGGAQDQGGAQVYNLVRDRVPRKVQPPVRFGFEELAAYALVSY